MRVALAGHGCRYADYTWLLDDRSRFEIIAGRLYLTPWCSPAHQEVAGRFFIELRGFASRIGAGEVLARLPLLFAESDYLVPDLVALPFQQQGGVAVHLVVEVVSQFTALRDRGVKRDRYARFGVPEYWIIDPTARHVEVYRLQQNADQPEIVSDRLAWQPVKGGPTLELNVGELLSNLD